MIQVTERTINKHGQVLLVPEITVEGWWTNMDLAEEKIISLYKNHGLSEQFHMALGAFAYNILRFIGQLGLLGEKSPVRHPGKRRRLKTVMQELMYLAARLIASGRRLRLRFSRHCPAFQASTDVYGRLSAGV